MKNKLIFTANKYYDLNIRIFKDDVFICLEYNTNNGFISFIFSDNKFSISINNINNNEITSEFFKNCNDYLDIIFKFNNINGKTHCIPIEKTFKNIKINKNALITCDIYDEIFVYGFQYLIQKALGDSYCTYDMELTLIDTKEG